MADRPLELPELRMAVARKAWHAYRSENDSHEVPSAFYYITDLIIRESYNNIQKMIDDTIKRRLEGLYNS